MTRPRAALALVILTALSSPSASAGEVAPTTPEAVWAGYDPRAEPLEIEVIRRWSEGGSELTEFTFTGMTREGSRVRVYAISGVPRGKRSLPGILHIHGGGQTVNPAWLRFWNSSGYAALTFNWGGVWPNRDKFTDWAGLTQGNHKDAGARANATEPTVRSSSWYLWTRVTRRALTALERIPEVDPNRLGIFGVSMGGTIVWPLAAMDDRVQVACAIYGVGWNTYPDEKGAPDLRATDPRVLRWRDTMEAESYARLVKCPMLFLNSTNDQHGNMDRSFETLERVSTETRWAYTPRFRHHIAAEQGADLPLWMDAHLKRGSPFPGVPAARLRLGPDGVPQLVVEPDASSPTRRVDVYHAVSNRNPKNRYWRSTRVRRVSTTWVADLPILDADEPLFAFANVLHETGVCLTTRLLSDVPKALGKARATDQTSLSIADFREGFDGWVTSSPATDPIPPVPDLLVRVLGPGGRPGVTVSRPIALSTHKVGDPKWRGPDGSSLELLIHARAPKILRVILHEREFSIGWTQYAAEVALEPRGNWIPITLRPADFATETGQRLSKWTSVQQLELKTKPSEGAEPVLGGARWVPAR